MEEHGFVFFTGIWRIRKGRSLYEGTDNPRGFANYGLDQVERMKSKGLEVHYNATGKAYTHEEFKALSKDADAIIVGVDKMDREMMEAVRI